MTAVQGDGEPTDVSAHSPVDGQLDTPARVRWGCWLSWALAGSLAGGNGENLEDVPVWVGDEH
jgi:hypothetical protein